jgi:curved DNA-binding protein CbpA
MVTSSGKRRSSNQRPGKLAAAAPSYYDALGVPPTATATEIKVSWKRLIRENHPDHAPLAEREAATERAAAINEAYQTLIDPARRARYDRKNFNDGRGRVRFASEATQREALDALVRLRRERRVGVLRTGGAAALGLAAIVYTLRWLKLF